MFDHILDNAICSAGHIKRGYATHRKVRQEGLQQMSTKMQQQIIEWRRAKVVEMRARGMSQIEIAHELQVSKQLISADVQYLRSQAKEFVGLTFIFCCIVFQNTTRIRI